MEVVASLSQGRTAAAQCGLFTHESVPVIFEPPCMICVLHTEIGCQSVVNPTSNSRSPANFTPEVFLRPLQTDSELVPQICPRPLPSLAFPLPYALSSSDSS